MKALCIAQNKFRLYADSSIHRNNQPVFLPDIEYGWQACICPAIRISRLGMHISPKFAPRYFDSASVACLFTPKNIADSIIDMPERFFVMDSAFSIGEWQKIEDPDQCFNIASDAGSLIYTSGSLDAVNTVAGLSSFMTFKMGDLLIFANHMIRFDITQNIKISVSLNNSPCINLKIK